MLRVSALHYSAIDWVMEGFQTVASAHALHQPTSCGSEYFYNQCPQVPNLIGTEHSLNRSKHRVQNEASLRVIRIDGIWNMKAGYFQYMEIRSQRYSQWWELDYGSWMDVGSDQRSSRQ